MTMIVVVIPYTAGGAWVWDLNTLDGSNLRY